VQRLDRERLENEQVETALEQVGAAPGHPDVPMSGWEDVPLTPGVLSAVIVR
jgi:hypothetical protein